MLKQVLILAIILSCAAFAGETPDDPKLVKRIPPPGVPLKPEDRAELEKGIAELGKEIEALKTELKDKPQLLELLPDIQIYHNAVRYAVTYDEFYNQKEPAKEIATAKALLANGLDRAKALRAGNAPWNTATGNIARGYVSKIDGSVQPYGLVVPAGYDPKETQPRRLDLWYHGRGETLSELSFINERQTRVGDFAPKDAFVLHPYGRYCNANKFAGEVDTFEALEHAKKHYRIDENRVSVRGFSMGGAACWQYAVHFPGLWAAAAPGAGFSETPEFTRAFQGRVKPTDFEQKLWHIYDATHYAENLFNLPTVAYSGEKDGQKQAADMMAKAMKEVGMELTHIIGPGAGHQYEAKAKIEVSKRIDEIVAKGRNPVPKHIKFVTYTLRYNQSFWIELTGLGEHWKKARIEAKINGNEIEATTENVSQLVLKFAPGLSPFQVGVKPKVSIDGKPLEAGAVQADRSWTIYLHKHAGAWIASEAAPQQLPGPRKGPGIQGPIDDAFMDSFIFVTPTGQPLNAKVGDWTKSELEHAIEHWRRTYRGEARVVKDTELSDEQIKNCNIVLWGDPSSNKVLAKIIDKLPLKWTDKEVMIGATTLPAAEHVPLLIYPNPLNPNRYVVLNSSFTHRENEYLNNAKQNAKLPDWAIVDVTNGPTSRWPGKVVKADFFDEKWEVK